MASSKRRRGEAAAEEEDFNSKRQRTDEAVYIRTTTWEEVESVRVRLFKWKDTLPADEQFKDSGVMFFQFYTFKDDSVGIPDPHFFFFPLPSLGRGCEDKMRAMLEDTIGETGHALDEHQIKGLAEQVVTHLSSNFRFTRRSLSSARTSSLVLFIEVDLTTVEERRRVFDIGDCSLEEEYGDLLEQPSAEFDQFVGDSADSDSSEETLGDETLGEEDDEDQSLMDFNQFVGNLMEFDSTEETLGEDEDQSSMDFNQFVGNLMEFDSTEETLGEDEDQSFVGFNRSEDDYVESDTEETGEAEEEQSSVDFDHSEDNYVELNTEETGEEVDMLRDQENHVTEEPETIMDTDQDCRNSGREEDGDQEDHGMEEEYNHGEENYPVESDTEYGFDLNQPFSTSRSASDYVVADQTGETQGTEEYGYDGQDLDQPFGNFGSASDYAVVDHTGETQGTEEYGYDGYDLYQPFGSFGSASDYAVVDHTGETQGEAAAAEDFYQFESDTEEIGGEEEEDTEETCSDPELIEIEDTLWRLTEKGSILFVSKVDRDRSRDSRSLKQVKDAMEIIKEFGSNDEEVDSCSLCLGGLAEEGKAVARTRCSHLFHRSCLCSWLSRKDSCPLCRSKCCTVV